MFSEHSIDIRLPEVYLLCRYAVWRLVMLARVQKWGNSLALRVPKALASEVGLEENSQVELKLVGETLVVTPVKREWTLEALLADVTEENVHSEVDWGPSVGAEQW
jgi:antitoxin MazE